MGKPRAYLALKPQPQSSLRIAMASALQRYFFAPRVPNLGAGFIDDNFAVVDLRRKRGSFAIAASAATKLPATLMQPSFDDLNLRLPGELVAAIRQTIEAAGLANKKRWSVALPDGVARTLVVHLESKPANRKELEAVLAWKIERVIGHPASHLRLSRQRLSPVAGQERYLISAAREEVIGEYESLFENLGWQVGLFLPRHLGEMQWLMWDAAAGDKLLVSGNRSGFSAVITRNREPILARSYVCEPEARLDELHRLAVYYRDKLAGANAQLEALLALGGIPPGEAQAVISDAIEMRPRLLHPSQFGFELAGEAISFDQLAGAAGLATLGWQ